MRRHLAALAALVTATLVVALLPATAGAATTNRAYFFSGSTWRYLDTSTAAPYGWERTVFNDGSWKAGPSQLGAGDGDELTRINRNAPNHAVDFFRMPFTVADRTKVLSLTFKMLADDGAVVYLNGTRVATDNMNSRLTAAATVRDGAAESTWRSFSLPAASLVNGTNVVAVAVFQVASSDKDSSFDASLVGSVSIADPTTTTTAPAGPDETATLQAALDAAPPGSTFTVDRLWRVDGTVTVRVPVNLSFTSTGMLYRGTRSTLRVLPVLVVDPAGSGSRFTNLRIQGPSGCDWRYPTGADTFVNRYDATVEAQHGVDVRGAANLVFTAPVVDGMDGDGINIAGNARSITVDDARITCVGRNAVSNTGATDVTVNRGSFSGAGLWAFNVEPFNSYVVDRYTVTGAKVGMSGATWLFASGPDFNCQVFSVAFTGLDRSGAGTAAPEVAACVAAQIKVS